MARKQILVQLDDVLLEDLDALASSLDVSRSELIRRAARLVIDNAQTLVMEEQHRKGYARIPEDATWHDDYAAAVAEPSPRYAAKPATTKHAKR